MEIMKRLKAALDAAKGVSNELLTLERQTREEHAQVVHERELLLMAPVPPDEAVRNMRALVAAAAQHWRKRHEHGLVRAFGGYLEIESSGTGLVKRSPRMYTPLGPQQFTFTDLCGLLPEVVGDAFEATIRGCAAEVGAPLEMRERLLEQADAAIRHIEEKHGQLVDDAAALEAPVILELFPDERARRAAKAARARDQAEARAVRRGGEVQVNIANRARTSSRESDYLAGARRRPDDTGAGR